MAQHTSDETLLAKIQALVHEEQHLYGQDTLGDHDQIRLERSRLNSISAGIFCDNETRVASSGRIQTARKSDLPRSSNGTSSKRSLSRVPNVLPHMSPAWNMRQRAGLTKPKTVSPCSMMSGSAYPVTPRPLAIALTVSSRLGSSSAARLASPARRSARHSCKSLICWRWRILRGSRRRSRLSWILGRR